MEVLTDGASIIFSGMPQAPKEKSVTLNIDGFNRYHLARYLEMLYITNFTKIRLLHSKSMIYNDHLRKEESLPGFIKKRCERYIGMEIIAQSRSSTELRCFLLDEEKDLTNVEKRVFFLFKDTVDEFMLSLDKDHAAFYQNLSDYNSNITKFITYFLRVLDQSDKSDEEKKLLYSLYMLIDKMVDKFRHLNKMVAEYGCSKRVKHDLKQLFELTFEQFTVLHKGEFPLDLVSRRYGLVRKIEETNYTPKELKLICEIIFFVDTLNEFIRVVIIRNLQREKEV